MDTEIVQSRISQLNYGQLRSALIAELDTKSKSNRSTSIISRFSDFWLLGGASIVVWAVMALGQAFREKADVVDNHFQQFGAFCSLMSILCNNPHFIISYRFGYGRGTKFVLKNWLPLLVVPLGLLALYALAYFKFDTLISDLSGYAQFNSILESFGLPTKMGAETNLGTAILTLSLWIMNLTVGWHYSKQAFGCMMVYAHYDQYILSKFQKNAIKVSVLSVATYFFLDFVSTMSYPNAMPFGSTYSIALSSFEIPKFLLTFSGLIVFICAAVVVKSVFIKNYLALGKRPSWNFLIPWIAIHIWWIPFVRQKEFIFMAVPFFHSLQYLPFAYRLEKDKIKRSKWMDVNISLRVALLIVVGFLAFELIPSGLDKSLNTMWTTRMPFFMSAFSVFINVHHFFIDSVVWKFDQSEIRESLLSKNKLL